MSKVIHYDSCTVSSGRASLSCGEQYVQRQDKMDERHTRVDVHSGAVSSVSSGTIIVTATAYRLRSEPELRPEL
jgi:hypothetical protein